MDRYSSLAVGLVLTLGLSALRADQLDLAVKKKGSDLVGQLQKNGVKVVGVLPFRIQIGEAKPSFDVSSLNAELSGLVENALILSLTNKEELTLVRDVTATADKAKVGDWFSNTTERAKLFAEEYPTAWGTARKKADGLLTGDLKLSKDLAKATLTVELFTAKEPEKRQQLAEFDFKTDAALLTDLGRGFNLRADGRQVKARGVSDWTREVTEQANLVGSSGTLKDLKDLGGVDFRVIVEKEDVTNGVKREENASHNQWTMPSPGEKAVAFKLTNTTPNKLAVLLKLNEQNVLQMDVENQKIFLGPKGSKNDKGLPADVVTLNGFVRERNGRQELAPFKSLVGEAAQRAKDALGTKEGFVSVTVYESLSDDTLPEIAVTERALSERTRTAPPEENRTDLKSYQDVLAKRGLMKRAEKKDGVNAREMIVPDEEGIERIRVKAYAFPNPNPVASVTIRIQPK